MTPSRESYTCALCGRVGVRGFIESMSSVAARRWVCRSGRACERRIRATGQVGIGVMRNYVR